MACCCSECDCQNQGKQWEITLFGWREECLNATYVFPFSGGGTLLCEGFNPGNPQFQVFPFRWQRTLEVSVFNCRGSEFSARIEIGTNALWSDLEPLPANYGSLSRPNGYRGWQVAGSLDCGGAIDLSGFLGTNGFGSTVSIFPLPLGTDLALIQGSAFDWTFGSGENDNIFTGQTGASANIKLQ